MNALQQMIVWPLHFEAQVRKTPRAAALQFDGEVWTYEDLNATVNRLARVLVARGAGPERIVALAMPRSVDLVVAILAVMKSGAAYLPIDMNYPPDRIAYMLNDAHPALVIINAETYTVGKGSAAPLRNHQALVSLEDVDVHAESSDNLTDAERLAPLHPRQAAYVIYTSGSTGRPKGVVVSHWGVGSLLKSQVDALAPGVGSRVLQFSSPSFDAAFWELTMALLSGATLILADSRQLLPGPNLTMLIVREGVTHVTLPPSVLALMPNSDLPANFTLVTAGEACPPAVAERWSSGSRMLNAYGPTEATVCSTISSRIIGSGQPTIGRPIHNTRVFVLDDDLRAVVDNEVGEIYIAGAGLARGYLKNPSLTAERFVGNPFGEPGEVMYRSGDLGRWTSDGSLEFVGRQDGQVKIRGFRVETGEVERQLHAHDKVSSAVVCSSTGPDGLTQLAAYVVPAESGPIAMFSSAEENIIGDWASLFESEYQSQAVQADQDEFSGWISSYNGLPILQNDMLEWVDSAVERILALGASRVLEVGVGRGALLRRVAPHCSLYWGSDVSQAAIRLLRDRVALHPEFGERVRLSVQPADSLAGLPRNFFDVVVLNSVVQYFGSQRYLDKVLDDLLVLLRPGGVLYIGDVRNPRMAEIFRSEVNLQHYEGDSAPELVLAQIEQDLFTDKELAVDPAYFACFHERNEMVAAVDIQLKRGRRHNELTRYRYEVLLHKRPRGEILNVGTAPSLSWDSGLGSLESLESYLVNHLPPILRVIGAPNGRVSAAVRALDALHMGLSVADAKTILRGSRDDLLDPEVFISLGRRLGYEVHVTWSSDGRRDRADVIFVRAGQSFSVLSGVYQELRGQYQSDCEPGKRSLSSSERSDLARSLRLFLRRTLPSYMVPAFFVILDKMPLTPSGKIDRQALPKASYRQREYARHPQTPQQEIACSVFADVLGLPSVGIDDGFFELGGHSLLAAKVITRFREVMGIEFDVRDLLEAPTIAQLLERAHGEHRQKNPELALQIRPHRLPLSSSQLRLWFLQQFEENGFTYNNALLLRLFGPLDPDVLRESISQVIARHEILRTLYRCVDGEVWQEILAAEDVVLPWRVVSSATADLQGEILEEARRPFNLEQEISLRTVLFEISTEEHVLLLVLHHIGADGWSLHLLLRDISRAYTNQKAGQEPSWDPLPVQYADYTLWQRQCLLGDERDPDSLCYRQLRFWFDTLCGVSGDLALPVSRRQAAPRSSLGARLSVELDAELHESLLFFAADNHSTLFIVLLAGIAGLLCLLGHDFDVPIGTSVAGRGDDALGELVGNFVNTLVMRLDVSGDPSFGSLVRQARAVALSAYENQDLPFERVVQAVNPKRQGTRNPIFRVMLTVHNTESAVFELPEIRSTIEEVGLGSARFDLSLHFSERSAADGSPDGLSGYVEYSTDVFDAESVGSLMNRLILFIARAASQPDTPISLIRLG